MTPVKWAILGPGAIAHNFADGLAEAATAELVAVCGRTPDRLDAFADRFGIAQTMRFDALDDLLASDAFDALYIATPHVFHAEQAVAALRAGKHVLVEKPAALSGAEALAVTEVAAQCNCFFMEGYMYRLHPQIAHVIDIVQSGEIGQVTEIKSQFGFNAPVDPSSRLFDPGLAGGAILDVGGYPYSLACLIAGVATHKNFARPDVLAGTGLMSETGVDARADAVLRFDGGIMATIAVAITQEMDNAAIITGTKGRIILPDPWTPGRNTGPSDAVVIVETADGHRSEFLEHREHLFAFEADAASKAIAASLVEPPFPAVDHAATVAIGEGLEAWRKAVGYVLDNEKPDGNRPIAELLPAGAPRIPAAEIAGTDAPISRLIMGCDNRDSLAQGAPVWDAFMQAGGNSFDTAFVYGNGLHEEVFGQWIKARGVEKEVQVIAKGAHSPYCFPDIISAQLDMSLDRLGLDHAAIYILHRDNPDVPVSEFIDALNRERDAGRIGIFGGSNWSVERLLEANDYAAQNGLEPFRILNNNLSLAVMEKEIWPGCISSNNPTTRDGLRANGLAHISWSSQARGYFLPAALRGRLPAEIGPDRCFGSPANEERRRRAEALAAQLNVSAHNIATAWVLAQPFASFAVIGPRSPGELVSTLPALDISLSEKDVAWLNLEID